MDINAVSGQRHLPKPSQTSSARKREKAVGWSGFGIFTLSGYRVWCAWAFYCAAGSHTSHPPLAPIPAYILNSMDCMTTCCIQQQAGSVIRFYFFLSVFRSLLLFSLSLSLFLLLFLFLFKRSLGLSSQGRLRRGFFFKNRSKNMSIIIICVIYTSAYLSYRRTFTSFSFFSPSFSLPYLHPSLFVSVVLGRGQGRWGAEWFAVPARLGVTWLGLSYICDVAAPLQVYAALVESEPYKSLQPLT